MKEKATMNQVKTGKFPAGSKFMKPSDAVVICVIAICTDPTHKIPSLYEMILSEIPVETQQHWREILRDFEPPEFEAYFSKDGVKCSFADLLDGFLISPVEDYVATSKASR